MTLARNYPTAEEAERIRRALAPDSTPDLTVRVEGSTLVLELRSRTPASARATAEDLLPCVAAAERAQGITSPEPPSESELPD